MYSPWRMANVQLSCEHATILPKHCAVTTKNFKPKEPRIANQLDFFIHWFSGYQAVLHRGLLLDFQTFSHILKKLDSDKYPQNRALLDTDRAT
ncbi:hypothetical protein BZG00_01605 [Salinivibrio kushneri]|uniref:Uncharacterized protein n=1 Tax=Salinivibrio kushneri TaxID=1908198 RepID=A0AB36K2Y2_9GAMM|nr:hypothetical protein BZG00_01605 [Salinivibrio kushneri]